MFLPCSVWFFFFTFEPTRQLSGKQHVGQLALTVRQPAVVAALAVEVVEADPAEVVGQGRDHHDPGRPAALQEPDEEVRQQEVAWKKKKREVVVNRNSRVGMLIPASHWENTVAQAIHSRTSCLLLQPLSAH